MSKCWFTWIEATIFYILDMNNKLNRKLITSTTCRNANKNRCRFSYVYISLIPCDVTMEDMVVLSLVWTSNIISYIHHTTYTLHTQLNTSTTNRAWISMNNILKFLFYLLVSQSWVVCMYQASKVWGLLFLLCSFWDNLIILHFMLYHLSASSTL